MADVNIEVAYALPEKQIVLKVKVDETASVRQAVIISGIDREFDGLDLANIPLGSYGKKIVKPEEQVVSDGMRIELYRPLIIDPKQARLNRAAKQAKEQN